jgi:anthranilate phosphoribosyltransferase
VRTNTPLQALTMLNDEAFFEAARALARRMVTESADAVRARAAFGFRIVTARQPTPQEIDRIVAAYRQHLEQFRAYPERAAQVASGYGLSGGDAAEQAAWTLVANALLNLDETITKE